jgi:hypothetical protein
LLLDFGIAPARAQDRASRADECRDVTIQPDSINVV